MLCAGLFHIAEFIEDACIILNIQFITVDLFELASSYYLPK